MTKPYLVTGASGFVGGHLVDLLLKRSVPVRALARDPIKGESLRKRGVEVFIGDLRDRSSLSPAVEGTKGIFHIGATFREPHLKEKDYFEINLEGTRSLIELAIKHRIPRFIHCSTTGVLGNPLTIPADENSPYAPADIYQVSKTEAEKLVLNYFREGKLAGNVIRPAMIYGPRDGRFLKIFKMIQKGTFFYVGKGDIYAHMIEVRDLAAAFLLAMEREDVNGEVFIIAGERALYLTEFFNMAADYLGARRPWLHLPILPMRILGELCERVCIPFGISPPIFRRRVDFFTKNRCFDTSKATRVLGFKPARSFKDELHEVLDWYRANGDL